VLSDSHRGPECGQQKAGVSLARRSGWLKARMDVTAWGVHNGSRKDRIPCHYASIRAAFFAFSAIICCSFPYHQCLRDRTPTYSLFSFFQPPTVTVTYTASYSQVPAGILLLPSWTPGIRHRHFNAQYVLEDVILLFSSLPCSPAAFPLPSMFTQSGLWVVHHEESRQIH
jgi:hypothetical protein